MEITDNRGATITVTNLTRAIQQASLLKSFRHIDTSFQQSDKDRRAYWKDIYQKLLALRNQNGISDRAVQDAPDQEL